MESFEARRIPWLTDMKYAPRTLAAALLLSMGWARSSHAADSTRVVTPPPHSPVRVAPAKLPGSTSSPWFEGSYRNRQGTAAITIQRLAGDFYYLFSTQGWEGVGILQGAEYEGVFREPASGSKPGALGRHVIYWRDDNGLEVHRSNEGASDDVAIERWHRVTAEEAKRKLATPAATPSMEVAPPAREDAVPKFGEYVYVEELPEAITKVLPIYPDAARDAGAEGTVMVQALVLQDGTIGDTKIVKSIPLLDAAAVECVRQWRFKPALNKGLPVAVWVAAPVKFSLH
jgi:TonB family protein